MRNIFQVAHEIKALIPPHKHKEHAVIDSLISSIQFASPEMKPYCWNRLSRLLNEIVCQPPVTAEWELKVIAVFTDKSFEEVTSLYGPGSNQK